MKKFNKVLAIVLAMFMLIAAVPFSAFADAWLEVDSTIEGNSSTVTVTVDAGTLAAILEEKGISPDLIKDMKDGVSVDIAALKEAFTVAEVLEIVPRESWLEIFDVQEIVESIGLEKLQEYVDIPALLQKADDEKLAALLKSIPDLDEYVDAIGLIEGGYITEKFVMGYVYKAELEAALANLDPNVVMPTILNMTPAEINQLVNVTGLLNANPPVLQLTGTNGVLDNAKAEAAIKNAGVTASELEPYVNVALAQQVLEAKYNTAEKIQALIDGGYITGHVEGSSYQIDSIDAGALYADGKITLDELLAKDGAVDVSGLANYLVNERDGERVDVQSVISLDKVKTQLASANKATLLSYVYTDKALEKIGAPKVIEWLGGYGAAKQYINIPALVSALDLKAVLASIPAEKLDDLVNFPAIMDVVDLGQVLNVVPMDAILAQLDNEELMEIVQLIDLKQYIMPVLTTVFDKVMWNVDKVEMNGFVVAAEAKDKVLALQSANLVKALASLIPSLEEFAQIEDGKLVTLDLSVVYTVDGTPVQKTKNVTFEFVLEGDISRLQDAAAKLDTLLKTYINEFDISEGVVTLDVTVPAKVTQLYAKVVDTDKLSDDLKVKLLGLVNTTGDDVVAFTEELTLGEIVELMEAVNPNKLYNALLNVSYVDAALDKVSDKFGYQFDEVTLDDIVDAAANVPSVERISEIIENKTGRDVLAYVEKLAIKADGIVDRVEKISAVQKILDQVEGKFGVDLGDVSAAEIVDRAKDVPISKKVSDIVANKVGINVRDLLNTYSVDELYAAALEKVAAKQGAYNKVKNYLLAQVELLPDGLMDNSLSDLYNGDGVFGGSKTVTFNAKAVVEKVVNKVAGKLGLDAEVVDLLISRVKGGELTVGADLTVRFQNLYRITYMSRDGKTELFSAFLPTGTDLSIFKNNSDLTGYEFQAWTDAEGNEITHMPAADTVVYADRNAVQITFKDQATDNVIGTLMVEEGDTLAMYAEEIAKIAAKIDLSALAINEKLFDGYYVAWYLDGARVKNTYEVTEDIVLVGVPRPDYFLKLDIDVEYDVTYANGVYTLTIHGDLPEGFALNLDNAHLLADAANGTEAVTLKVVIGNTGSTFLTFADATLAQLHSATATDVVFHYTTPATTPDSFADTAYENINGAAFYTFDITVDGNKFADAFAEAIRIEVPFTGAISNKTDEATRVHTITNGVRELVSSEIVGTEYVAFAAPHFSDFVIANEYLFELVFTDGTANKNGSMVGLDTADLFFPEGHTFVLNFEVERGYRVTDITVEGDNTDYAVGDIFTMPAAGVKMTVTVATSDFYIYYYVNGALSTTVTQYNLDTIATVQPASFADLTVAASVPAGYTKEGGHWAGYDSELLGKADMYLVAEWALLTYTVTFEGTNTSFTNVTIKNFDTVVVAPAVPEQEGMVGTWKTFNATDMLEKAVNGVYTVSAEYNTKLSYTVSTDANVNVDKSTANMGDEITITVDGSKLDPNFYTTTVTVTDAKGNNVPVTDGKFTMPASNVYVTVTATLKDVTYTIQGEERTGKYGDTVEFTVTVPAGKVLTTAPAGCALTSYEVNEKGEKVLTYSFKLNSANIAITYTVSGTTSALFKIFNGMLFNGGTPESDVEDVTFTKWSAAVAGIFSFANFEYTGVQSLLWLWIVLAILLLILIIAVLYLLYINGKVSKPLFLFRFITWIVSLFFGLCLALSGLALKVAKLFGKSDNPDDYGFEEVTDEETAEEATEEETTEETTEEEATEESTEEVTDEAAAIVAAEATEEAAEEATEEVAEEATEEVTEEATEEVTEEATEEVAEEATEEAAEEEKKNPDEQ